MLAIPRKNYGKHFTTYDLEKGIGCLHLKEKLSKYDRKRIYLINDFVSCNIAFKEINFIYS